MIHALDSRLVTVLQYTKKKKTRMRNHNHIICFLVYIFKTSQLRSHESDRSRGSSLD